MVQNPLSNLKVSKGFANMIGIIGLLVTYLSLFGLNSLKTFLEKDVIIITHEESPSSIFPPGYYYLFIYFIVNKKLDFYN